MLVTGVGNRREEFGALQLSCTFPLRPGHGVQWLLSLPWEALLDKERLLFAPGKTAEE